ncbi:MAG TPA: hypothetical protein DCG75_19365 [Bacteroidales bacterium]|jgi:cell fate regulator YaaT (PSP1 superfamily)|nr:hypothetical protein [Bacteroidales bacterium]
MGCESCDFKNRIKEEFNAIKVTEKYLNSCTKLNSYSWLDELPDTSEKSNLVEVRFKNTRKEFFENSNKLRLTRGDIIAVEAMKGHDVGIVTLLGSMALLQFKRKTADLQNYMIRRIYRKATPDDVEKWKRGKEQENSTMIKAREIANNLKLDMKISDVEYQGDNTRAIFYYIAEGRIDYRELIKVFAKEFNIQIEMKQIGARQEAGLIGGLGSCGRELCCSTWKTNLNSVPIDVSRIQDLSPKAQFLTGKCGRLKCCLMYELDDYLEAWEDFPEHLLQLETEKGIAYKQKLDVLNKKVWYSYKNDYTSELIPVTTIRIREIIMMNKKGQKPKDLDQS